MEKAERMVNKADTLLKLTDGYIKDVEMVNLTAEGFSTTNKKVLEKYKHVCYELEQCKTDLKILVESLNKNG